MKDLYNHRISISGLNLLGKSPRAYKKYIEDPRDEESEALRKGSALDCMLTEPEEFNNRYAVATMDPPGGMMGEFVRHYITYKLAAVDKECAEDSYIEDEIRQMAYKASGFKIKFEAVIKKFEADDIQKYIKFIRDSKGKTILSPMEHLSASGMKEMLLNNEFTKKYLVDLPSNPLIDDINQLSITWKYKDFECKSILDKVLVDHNEKRIIPIDIKTTSKGISNFIQSYIRYGYFRQCSFYNDAIRYWLFHISEIKDPEAWTIEPFRFIVVDSNLNEFPLVYVCSEKDLYIGKHGGYLPKGINKLKGFDELVDELEYYQKTRDWRYTKEVQEANGEILMDIFE